MKIEFTFQAGVNEPEGLAWCDKTSAVTAKCCSPCVQMEGACNQLEPCQVQRNEVPVEEERTVYWRHSAHPLTRWSRFILTWQMAHSLNWSPNQAQKRAWMPAFLSFFRHARPHCGSARGWIWHSVFWEAFASLQHHLMKEEFYSGLEVTLQKKVSQVIRELIYLYFLPPRLRLVDRGLLT